MTNFSKENRWFLIWLTFFLVIGAIVLFNIETGDGTIYFSERRTTSLDWIFRNVTKLGEERIYFALVIIFLFIRFRYSIWVASTGIIAMIVSFFLKKLFLHPRPSVFFMGKDALEQINFVDGVYVHTGYGSFPSGHTLSAFALYGLLAFLFTRKPLVGTLMFLIALSVGLSRIYLVQHFLKDIYLGAVLGVLTAIFIYAIEQRLRNRNSGWGGGSLMKVYRKLRKGRQHV